MVRFIIPGRHLVTLVLVSVGLLLMSTVAGCGGSGRGPVSGTVTLDDQPLEHGVINFRPVEGFSAPGSGGVVTGGSFEIPAAKGLQPGKYKVTISAFKKTGRMIQDFPNGPKRPERLPVEINESGRLEATVDAVEENCLNFQLTTSR